MMFQLRIHTPDPALSTFLTQIFELFGPRFLTPMITGNSADPLDMSISVQFEIDGGKELTQEQWQFLSTHRHTLLFMQPPRQYTREEVAELDALDAASQLE